ncbi:MAG: acyl-CoA dehydrogenase family protein [Nitrospirota bacterium]|nr:acyl-CoA dehydrogenase family protein [Nitrospirota bacterium]
MDFLFSEDERLLQESVREFARREIAPLAAEIDRTGVIPDRLILKMAEMGLMGISMPQGLGGAGMSTLCYAIALEEVAAACGSTSTLMAVNNSLACWPLNRYGTSFQKERFLMDLTSGKKLGAFALTEAAAGSDAAHIQTEARRVEDGFVLNGNKLFVSEGARAGVVIVFAVTDREKGHKGLTAFITENGMKGFRVGRSEKKMGIRGSDATEIILEDCFVPNEHLLGREGEGFKIAMETLDGGRISIAAQSVGLGRAAYEAALDYARNRQQFGRPLSDIQAIQFMLADCSTELDAARILTHRAATLKDEERRYAKESSMAKLYASEAANRIAYRAIQIHGGYGYTEEYPVERIYRDARVTTIYEGTSEMQRLTIAKELLRS